MNAGPRGGLGRGAVRRDGAPGGLGGGEKVEANKRVCVCRRRRIIGDAQDDTKYYVIATHSRRRRRLPPSRLLITIYDICPPPRTLAAHAGNYRRGHLLLLADPNSNLTLNSITLTERRQPSVARSAVAKVYHSECLG